MDLKDQLNRAEKLLGGRQALAEALDLNPDAITAAKANRRGLPVFACVELAKLINVDPMTVISASELVTEKNERRKAVFFPFVQMAGFARLSMIALLAAISACLLVVANSGIAVRAFLL